MNNLEFKAWHKGAKKFIPIWKIEIDYKNNTIIGIWDIRNHYYFIVNIILLPYIGVKDKNDKKIYVGDYIVDYDDYSLFIVNFKEGLFGYDIYDLTERNGWEFVEFDSIDFYNYNTMDFTNNIFENPITEGWVSVPELLEVE